MFFRRLFTHEPNAARVDQEIDDELAFHFDMAVRDLQEGGLSEQEARREALRRFGDRREWRDRLRSIDHTRVRARRRADLVDVLRQQLLAAVRSFRRQPLLTGAVMATFALGLGANAAMFTLLDRLLLQPPAGVRDASAVVRVFYSRPVAWSKEPFVNQGFAYVDVVNMRERLAPIASVTAYSTYSGMRLGREKGTPTMDMAWVLRGYFDLLGVRPALGRFFTLEELDPARGPAMAVVLSHHVWRDRFQADRDVLGRTIEIEKQRYTVIGVAPEGFAGVDLGAIGVWLPASTYRLGATERVKWYESRSRASWLTLLRPVTPLPTPLMAERIRSVHLAFVRAQPGARDTIVTMLPSPLLVTRGPAEPQSGVSIAFRLGGVSLLILLIACANIANLLLARAMHRQREIAVRLALGISRARLTGQLVLESVLLALGGSIAALLVAQWAGAALRALLLPRTEFVGAPLSSRVVLFTLLVAVVTGTAAGLAPAWQARRRDLTNALRGGARDGTTQHSRLNASLIVAQTSLSLMLLIGTGLFVRSLQRAASIDPGFDMDQLISVRLSDFDGPREKERVPVTEEILARVRALPGIEQVALSSSAPMRGYSFMQVRADGRDSVPLPESGPPTHASVSGEFFSAVGLRVTRGRGIAVDDRVGTEPVVVVNSLMSETYWPGESALGKCLRLGAEPQAPCTRVVGVTENARRSNLVEKPMMLFWVPLAQQPDAHPGVIIVRTAASQREGVVRQLEGILQEVDPEGDGFVTDLGQTLSGELRPWRLGALLFGVCGLLALVVSALGIYSTIAYTVTQRMHEFGVRIALGARVGDIIRHVMTHGMRTVIVGIVVGVGATLLAGRLVASLLYDTSTTDPLVMLGAGAVLLAAAACATLIPSWRAGRVDPMVALRSE